MHPGFIMVLTLLVIALATMMTSVMFDRSGSYVPYMKAVIDRQKAAMLALGGLAIVQEQLSRSVVVEQKEEQQSAQQEQKQTPKDQKVTAEQKMQHLFKIIMPTLNRWQHFELTEEHDGVDGTLSVCLMSEEGKINLNKIFDFEKKQFVGEIKTEQEPNTPAQKPAATPSKQDWKKNLAFLFNRIEKETKATELLLSLEAFLKKRDYPLNDITELLAIKNFAPFKHAVYYEPPREHDKKNKKNKQPYALADLFTLYSDAPTIEPWLLSDSMIGVLGVPRAQPQDEKNE